MLQTFNPDYNATSQSYDRSHDRWLRYAGGEAQCAFEGAVTALLHPGRRVLDVACGTGAVVRRLQSNLTGAIDLHLLDSSPRMLSKCADIAADKHCAKMEHMPFADDYFDLLTCAWGLETSETPQRAMSEFMRVLQPGGSLALVFCADRPARSPVALGLKRGIQWSGRGTFLDPKHVRKSAEELGCRQVQTLHCSGPAAALLIHL